MNKGRNPVEYVAPELWTIIFDKLQSSVLNGDIGDDNKNPYYNCYNVCSTFQDILRPTISTWLFSEIAPFIELYITRADIFNCRRVCKWWRYGIDQYIENQGHSKSLFARHREIHKSYITCFVAFDELLAFYLQRENDGKIAFPGGALSLGYGREPTGHEENLIYSEFWTCSTLGVLPSLGHHLTSLHLKLSFKRESWNHSLTVLNSCLEATPHLKTLHISGYSRFQRDEEMDTDYFNISPLPPLVKLESMYFSSGSRFQQTSYNSVPIGIQYFICDGYFHQLKRLQLHFPDGPLTLLPKNQAKMPSMQEIQLSIFCVQQLHSIFEPLTNAFVQLQSVTIEIANPSTQTRARRRINLLFKILSLLVTYKTSVRELAIVADEPGRGDNFADQGDVICLKQFSNLKHLRILGICFAYVKIIRWLPGTLESLHVSAYNRYGGIVVQEYVSDDLRINDLREWHGLWQSVRRLKWIRVDHNRISKRSCEDSQIYTREQREWWMRVHGASKQSAMCVVTLEAEEREHDCKSSLYRCIKIVISVVVIFILLGFIRMSRTNYK